MTSHKAQQRPDSWICPLQHDSWKGRKGDKREALLATRATTHNQHSSKPQQQQATAKMMILRTVSRTTARTSFSRALVAGASSPSSSSFALALGRQHQQPLFAPKRALGTSNLERLVKEKKERGESNDYTLQHPLWNDYEVHNVEITHREPVTFLDKLAYNTIKVRASPFPSLPSHA